MTKKPVLFIVEDDETFNKMLSSYFTSKHKWEVHSFLTGEESLKDLHLKPAVWLQDFELPGMNGIQVMKKVKKELPQTEFIFLSGQGSIQVAVETLKEGAFDYVIKDSSSKENALNKVDQVMYIKRLETNRKSIKLGFIVVSVCYILSWLIYFLIK